MPPLPGDTAWTDGSKTHQGAGWVVVTPTFQQYGRLTGPQTSCRGELTLFGETGHFVLSTWTCALVHPCTHRCTHACAAWANSSPSPAHLPVPLTPLYCCRGPAPRLVQTATQTSMSLTSVKICPSRPQVTSPPERHRITARTPTLVHQQSRPKRLGSSLSAMASMWRPALCGF